MTRTRLQVSLPIGAGLIHGIFRLAATNAAKGIVGVAVITLFPKNFDVISQRNQHA